MLVVPGKLANQTCREAVIDSQTPARCGETKPNKTLIPSNVVIIYFKSDSVSDGSTGFHMHYQGGKLEYISEIP